MGLLQRAFQGRSIEHLFSEAADQKYFSRGVWSTATGLSVSPETSLQVTAVLACVRVLAESIASLPLVLYKRLSRGKERAVGHYLYSILHDQANPEMTSFEFREVSMGHLATWGNSFANIERSGSGRVRALWPLRPDRMRVYRVAGETGAQLVYRYRLPDSAGGGERTLLEHEVLHIRGLSPDGIVGYSPIQLARQAVGLSLAMEEFGGRFFGNGAIPGLALSHPGQLSDLAHKHLKESWEEEHQGLTQAHRFAILEEGMKVEKIGIPPDDSQFIESRKMQVNEIARIYRMPLHKIQDLEHATFSNIEHQAIEFVVDTLRPWCVRWEQRIRQSLLGPEEARSHFAEFLVDGLLRGDVSARYTAYATARQNGWMSANEIRELENQNPIPGGDEYLVPLNMEPSGGLPVPPNGGGGAKRGRSAGETRASEAAEKKKAARARLATAVAYRRVFVDAGERAVKAELREIKKAAQNFFGRLAQPAAFDEWLTEYYKAFPEMLEELWEPVFFSISEAIQAMAAREVGAAVGMTPGLDECLRYHIERSAARHASLSATLLRQAVAAGGASVASVEGAMEDWLERRPAAFASWETIRTSNMMAKATWFYAGATGLEWVRLDENPFCESLDGVVIEMTDNCRGTHFVLKGAPVLGLPRRSGRAEPEELKPSWNVATPPLFGGCECQISPVMPDEPQERE